MIAHASSAVSAGSMHGPFARHYLLSNAAAVLAGVHCIRYWKQSGVELQRRVHLRSEQTPGRLVVCGFLYLEGVLKPAP